MADVEVLILCAVGLPGEHRVMYKDPDAVEEKDERGLLGDKALTEEEATLQARIENAQAKKAGLTKRFFSVPFTRNVNDMVSIPAPLARRYEKGGIAIRMEGLTAAKLTAAKKITKEAAVGAIG